MALNFQPPSFVQPLQYEAIGNISGGIDELYNTYLRQQAFNQERELRGLQIQGQREDLAANRFSRRVALDGVDSSQVTEDTWRAAMAQPAAGPFATPAPAGGLPTLGPAGPTSAPAPSNLAPQMGLPENFNVVKFREFLNQRKKTAALEAFEKMASLRKEQSQASLYDAQAEALRRGDIYFDPVSGRQVAVPSGAKPLPKPDRPASTEYTARGFADKATQANASLQALIARGFDPAAISTGFGALSPNLMKSSEVQQSEQALRQFVNAVLRRESGAAIPETELRNYRKQYWPETGDSQETLAQKTESRKLAIAGLETEGSRVPSALPATGGSPKPGTVEDGYRFKGGDPASPTSWEKI